MHFDKSFVKSQVKNVFPMRERQRSWVILLQLRAVLKQTLYSRLNFILHNRMKTCRTTNLKIASIVN